MIPDPVLETTRRFIEGQPSWDIVLARHLYAIRPELAFQWLKSCVVSLLPLQRSQNEPELQRDLQAIDSFADSCPSLEEIGRKAREIWYRPNRDAAQTAMSHLYAMIAARDPTARPGIGYAGAVWVLVDAAPDREAAFRTIVDEFACLTRKE